MKHLRRIGLPVVVFALTLSVVGAWAQESAPGTGGAQTEVQHPESQASATAAHEPADHEGASAGGANAAVGKILENATEIAAHRSETWGRPFGINHDTSFLISLLLNFSGIMLLFYLLFRSKIPQMFRNRTNSIQQAIREAQAASAEATERLKAVEARLAKLDNEVGGIRAEAEKQAAAEEARIRAAAEEDKNRVVESAKMEIDAIARNARRELKSYAATLAVDIAAKRIHVDEHSDQALVREFVDQLGKDGRQ